MNSNEMVQAYWTCPVCEDQVPSIVLANYDGRLYERATTKYTDAHKKLHAQFGLVISW